MDGGVIIMSLPLTLYHDLFFAITDRATARWELASSSLWTHVISIGDPGSRIVVSARRMGDRLLRREFDDVNPLGTGMTPETIFARWGYVAATPDDVKTIAGFGRALPPDAHLLIHCEQGISRSTAAAAIVLMTRYQLPESVAVDVVKGARPEANPNPWMLKLYGEVR